jgi:hypothetical protein
LRFVRYAYPVAAGVLGPVEGVVSGGEQVGEVTRGGVQACDADGDGDMQQRRVTVGTAGRMEICVLFSRSRSVTSRASQMLAWGSGRANSSPSKRPAMS